MYGTESQMVMESSLSLFPAVWILFRASYENRRISVFAMREGKLFQDMIILSCFSSDLSKLVEEFSLSCCTSMAHAGIVRYGAKIISTHAKKCSMRRFPSLRGGGRGKKATSEESSRGMNANENDFKSVGRINTKLNTQGNYDGLRREMC